MSQSETNNKEVHITPSYYRGAIFGRTYSLAKGKNRFRGFSIIESMFGILLLGLMGIVFGAAFPLAAGMQAGARYRAEAIRLARREMELLRQASYTSLTPASANGLTTLQSQIGSPVDGLTGNGTGYTWTSVGGSSDSLRGLMPGNSGYGAVYIEAVSTGSTGGAALALNSAALTLRRITVQASWTDHGVGHSVYLVSLVGSKSGLGNTGK